MTATVMKKMKMLIRIMMMVITDMCRDDNDNSLLCEDASRAFGNLQSDQRKQVMYDDREDRGPKTFLLT